MHFVYINNSSQYACFPSLKIVLNAFILEKTEVAPIMFLFWLLRISSGFCRCYSNAYYLSKQKRH